VLLSTTAPIRRQWFSAELVCGDDKHAVRHRICHIYHAEVPTGTGLPDRHARTLASWAILARTTQGDDVTRSRIVSFAGSLRSSWWAFLLSFHGHARNLTGAEIVSMLEETFLYASVTTDPSERRRCLLEIWRRAAPNVERTLG